MLASFAPEDLGGVDLEALLEGGRIVHFPTCPFPLPGAADLAFLREELPARLARKNVSYHPEADRVVGLDADPPTAERVHGILVAHGERVQAFLREVLPALSKGWTVGTTSFRPIQEQGRNLKAHASNELVHVDAGAYGATNGDRILRFFVNASRTEDRVWATRGAFPELYRRYGAQAGIAPDRHGRRSLEKGILDHTRSAVVRGLSAVGLRLARALDSSPYDRAMRRFHNFMKDDPGFRGGRDGYRELRFAPFSAWMVLTDMVSHACLSGQHAFISTYLLRLSACRRAELAPINVLRSAR